jgi:Holliday junction DNA helicase RuvA
MLSGARAADLALFLRSGDEKALAKLPGIGKKSAARLVVELGNRIPETRGLDGADWANSGPTGPLADATAVLGAMGLNPAAAEQALARALRADATVADDVEAWVKAALRNMS